MKIWLIVITILGSLIHASPVVAQWQLEDENYVALSGRARVGDEFCLSFVTLDVNTNVRVSPNSNAGLIANSGYGTNYTASALAQYGDWYLVSFEVGRSNYVGWTHSINIVTAPSYYCR